MKKIIQNIIVTFLTFILDADPLAAHTPAICQNHINFEEKSRGIEAGLLEAIATIESKLNPYSVNVQGRSYQFRTLQSAAAFVRDRINEGIQNISVGPMQLHVPSHRRYFKSIEDMIDPYKNITYAAKLFKKLKSQYGSCEKAVKYYHSANPCANETYKNRVFGAWARIKKRQKTCPSIVPQPITNKSQGLTDVQKQRFHDLQIGYHISQSPEQMNMAKIVKRSHDELSPLLTASYTAFSKKSIL